MFHLVNPREINEADFIMPIFQMRNAEVKGLPRGRLEFKPRSLPPSFTCLHHRGGGWLLLWMLYRPDELKVP